MTFIIIISADWLMKCQASYKFTSSPPRPMIHILVNVMYCMSSSRVF